MKQTDDLRIAATKELISPVQIHEQFPLTEVAAATTAKARDEIQSVMAGSDDRLVVVVGRARSMIQNRRLNMHNVSRR